MASARKTFNLTEDLARAVAREAARQGRPESAIAREAFEEYLTARSSSKLKTWVGKGRSERAIRHEQLHDELAEVLAERDETERRG